MSPDRCHTCHEWTPAPWICACCDRTVCDDCREEIAGFTHCPSCAEAARTFVNEGVRDVPAGLLADGQTLVPQPG